MPTIASRIEISQDEARNLLRYALQRTALSARAFSNVLAVDERTVRRWLAADRPMPGPVIQLCRLLTASPELVTRLTKRAESGGYTEPHTAHVADAPQL
jgi:DNA-binding transcriptional regulator YiaG